MAVHVGVGRVCDIGRLGEAGMSVLFVAFQVGLLDLLVGKALHNGSHAIVLEDFLAVGDDNGDRGLYLNFLVVRDNLLDSLKHDLGYHFSHVHHMHDLLINHDSDLLLVRDHHWDSDLFGHRLLGHDSLESILDLGRSAAALGGRTSTARASGASTAACLVASARWLRHGDSDFLAYLVIPHFGLDFVVNSLPIEHLLDWLLDCLELLHLMGDGDHHSLLHLTCTLLHNLLHLELDSFLVHYSVSAHLFRHVHLLVVCAGAVQGVASTAVHLDSSGECSNRLGLDGSRGQSNSKVAFH